MSGSWFDPGHEGEGFALEVLSGGQAIAYWFSYDEAGKQRWFLGVGSVSGSTATFNELYTASGAVFGPGFNPDDVILNDAGDLRITWSDCWSASAEYEVNGIEGTQTLNRLTSLAGLGCDEPIDPTANSGQTSMSGSWFDITHNGEGLVVEILDDQRALVYWFSYDSTGQPAWFFGIGSVEGTSIALDEMLITSGGRFGPEFEPSEVIIQPWGTAVVELGCEYGKLDYAAGSLDFGAGKQTLTRLSNPGSFDCQESAAPNLLLVIADDFGLDASNAYGIADEKPLTPVLDQLASEGLVFDNTWAYPTCSPTRAAILTGKNGSRTGVLNAGTVLSTNETSLQSFIDERLPGKYANAVIGKWHLGPSFANPDHPADMGIDHFAGILGGGVDDYQSWQLTQDGQQSHETQYATSKIADLAIEWVDEQQKPWFLWLAFNAPHVPFHLPPGDLHSQELAGTEEDIAENPLPYYLASIEALDTELGRILDSLEPAARENTIVVFIGDNGTPGQVAQSPFSRFRAKGSIYQGGINVPLFVSGPGLTREGQREDALVTAADLFATLASFAGVNVSQIHDSISFAGLVNGPRENDREYTFSQQSQDTYGEWAVSDYAYKLIETTLGEVQFYHLATDPYEHDDLAARGAAPANVLEFLRAAAASAGVVE